MFTTPPERSLLLGLARQSVVSTAAGTALPQVEPGSAPEALREKRANFVTLTKAGKLRGCIGTVLASEPLYVSVVHNAAGAASRDPRFDPVRCEEVPEIGIEISVLTEPEPLRRERPEEVLEALRPGIDGVLLRRESKLATFLPQVWAHVPDKQRFLALLSEKAGCRPEAWREPDTEILTYQVESFGETA